MFVHKLTGKTSDHKDKLKDSQGEGGDKQRAQTAWQQNAAITLQQITLTFVGGLMPNVLDTNRITATSLVQFEGIVTFCNPSVYSVKLQ